MRYRRYYSHRNADGSRTVVRLGPGGAAYLGFWKFFVVFAWLFIPLALVHIIGGVAGWIVGAPIEVFWLLLNFVVWKLKREFAENMYAGTVPGVPARTVLSPQDLERAFWRGVLLAYRENKANKAAGTSR